MLVVEIDHLDAEPLQARFAGRADIVGVAADTEELAVRTTHVAELGREEDPFAAVTDRASDQFLILEWAVHVRGVEEIDAALDGMVDGRDRLLVAAGAVEFAHAHTAEADRRDFGAVPAKAPLADLEHVLLPFLIRRAAPAPPPHQMGSRRACDERWRPK